MEMERKSERMNLNCQLKLIFTQMRVAIRHLTSKLKLIIEPFKLNYECMVAWRGTIKGTV